MKKVLVLVLVIGFLLGTVAAAVVCEETSFDEIDFTDDTPGDNPGGPAPCGGGNGSGAPG